MTAHRRHYRSLASSVAALILLVGCGSDEGISGLDEGPTVESVFPGVGFQGQSLDIRVVGVGFDEGSVIFFERGGAAATEIEVTSTTFLGPSDLVANVVIGPDADPGTYDLLVVTRAGKRGVGLEGFLVSIVVVGTLPGGVTSRADAINENGEIVGAVQVGFPDDPDFLGDRATYWFGGVLEDLGPGSARGISEECPVGGCRVVGHRDGRPIVWEKRNGVWTSTELPIVGAFGSAFGISAGGDRVVGTMGLPNGLATAVVWTEAAGLWTATELPPAAGSLSPTAHAINEAGQVAGHASGRPIVWTEEGGGWTPHELELLPGDSEARALAINSTGDVVGEGGFSGAGPRRALLWRRTSTGWDPPIDLVPLDPAIGILGSSAVDINDRGQVVGTVDLSEEDFFLSAFVWTERTGPLELGPFDELGTVGQAINESGQVAGTNNDVAILWTVSLQ